MTSRERPGGDVTAGDPSAEPTHEPSLETVERPWGCYAVVDAGEGFQVKRITVRPGRRLSYQRHARRAEHWFMVAGTCEAVVDEAQIRLAPRVTVDVPVGAAHRVANDGTGDLTFIEVQTGDYFGEDDIERLDDDYGRA